MPWAPEFRGPLPPALAAMSLRAFSSVCQSVSNRPTDGRSVCAGRRRTSALLLEVGLVVLVEVLGLLLGLLQRLGLAA